jgi:hypothetical protein
MPVYQLVDAPVTARSDRPGNFRLKFRTTRRSTVTDTAAIRTGAASRSPRAAFVTASRELQVQRASSISDVHSQQDEPASNSGGWGFRGPSLRRSPDLPVSDGLQDLREICILVVAYIRVVFNPPHPAQRGLFIQLNHPMLL